MPDTRTGQRFPLQLPIRLHRSGSDQPDQAVTGNLSAAGVYLRASSDLEEGSQVEFEIQLPPEATGNATVVTLQCRGRVVRTEETCEEGIRGVACVIDSYDLVREP